MALMKLVGWAVSHGQRNVPDMHRDVRRVKLGGNAAVVLNSRQGCDSATEAVKMQKCCLRVGGACSW